jgi:hypothetical protein
MAVNYVVVKGYIKDGKLNVDLPDNVADGEVEVTLPIAEEASDAHSVAGDVKPLTDEEIAALMKPNPKTGAEIANNPAIGAWANYGITDSVEWIEEQRRKRREKRG